MHNSLLPKLSRPNLNSTSNLSPIHLSRMISRGTQSFPVRKSPSHIIMDDSELPVECYDADTKEYFGWFPNIRTLAKLISLNESRIRYVCHGKRITAANLTFKFSKSCDPNVSEEEKEAQVKKMLGAISRPNPRSTHSNSNSNIISGRESTPKRDSSNGRTKPRNLSKSRVDEDGSSVLPNPKGAITVSSFTQPPSHPSVIESSGAHKPIKLIIKPSHPIYSGFLSYVFREIAPMLLQRGSMCKATLRYPADLWLPRNSDSLEFSNVANRTLFRLVCVVHAIPSSSGSFADYFLQSSNKDGARFIVFDGIRLYNIPFSQVVLPIEDSLLSYYSSRAMDSIDELPAMISKDVHKWVEKQWSSEEVSAYANTLSHFSTEDGHPDLNLLYSRNRVLNRRRYSELVEFHYNHPVFARLCRAKMQWKYCQSPPDKTRCLSRIEALEREKSNVLKVFRCSTLLRNPSPAHGSTLYSLVNYLYRERLVTVDVTRTDKIITVDLLPSEDVDDVLHRYDPEEAFDSMDDEVSSSVGFASKLRVNSSDENLKEKSSRMQRKYEDEIEDSSESDLESISDRSSSSSSSVQILKGNGQRKSLVEELVEENTSKESQMKSSISFTSIPPDSQRTSTIRYISAPEEKRTVPCRPIVQIDMLTGQPIRLFKSVNSVGRFLNVRCSSSIRKSIQSGKPSYGAFIWRDYDGPEVDFDGEPGQFYDLRIVTNFDWQPKLSFRARESIAAYQDIKHEEATDGNVGESVSHNHYIATANFVSNSSSMDQQRLQQFVPARSEAQRKSIALAGKCSDSIAVLRRPNIRESRIIYKHKLVPLYEALRWLPRKGGTCPASYDNFLRGCVSTQSNCQSAHLNQNDKSSMEAAAVPKETNGVTSHKPPEKKWSYQYYILDAVSRIQFNSMDPDLYGNIFEEILKKVEGKWLSIDKTRCFRAIDALYELDHIFERTIPPSTEFPGGIDMPVLSSSGKDLLKRLQKREDVFDAQLRQYEESISKNEGNSENVILDKSIQDHTANNNDNSNNHGTSITSSMHGVVSSIPSSISNLPLIADDGIVDQWMKRFCLEEMVVSVFQLGAFDSSLHTLTLNAFLCHSPDCPKEWRSTLSVKQQIEVLRHALDYACFLGYLTREKGFYISLPTAPVLPYLQGLADRGEIILDKDREDVVMTMEVMLQNLDPNPILIAKKRHSSGSVVQDVRRQNENTKPEISSNSNSLYSSNAVVNRAAIGPGASRNSNSLVTKPPETSRINVESFILELNNTDMDTGLNAVTNNVSKKRSLNSTVEHVNEPNEDIAEMNSGDSEGNNSEYNDEQEDNFADGSGRFKKRKLSVEEAALLSKHREIQQPPFSPDSTSASQSRAPSRASLSNNTNQTNRRRRSKVLINDKRNRSLQAIAQYVTPLFESYTQNIDVENQTTIPNRK